MAINAPTNMVNGFLTPTLALLFFQATDYFSKNYQTGVAKSRWKESLPQAGIEPEFTQVMGQMCLPLRCSAGLSKPIVKRK